MSTPPTVSVILGQQAYPPGAAMTASVASVPGTASMVTSYGAQEATGPDGAPGVLEVTFTTQVLDPVVLGVTDSAGQAWDKASGDSTASVWQATAPTTPGPLTVIVTATGQGSGLSATAAATATVLSPPAVGTNRGAWAAVSAATGPLTAYRGYDSPKTGVPSTWPGASAGPIPDGVLPIVSLNLDPAMVLSGALDAQLFAFAGEVPPGALVTVDAEDEAGRYSWTPEQIRGVHQRCQPIFKRASPDCLYGQVVTTFTAARASAHYPLATTTDPRWIQAGLDWYGLDAYALSAGDTPAANMGAAVAQMRLAGADGPWVVTEVNTHYGVRAAWLTAAYEYATGLGALAFCTFWGTAPYAWDASDTATIRALAQMTSATRM